MPAKSGVFQVSHMCAGSKDMDYSSRLCQGRSREMDGQWRNRVMNQNSCGSTAWRISLAIHGTGPDNIQFKSAIKLGFDELFFQMNLNNYRSLGQHDGSTDEFSACWCWHRIWSPLLLLAIFSFHSVPWVCHGKTAEDDPGPWVPGPMWQLLRSLWL